MRSRRVGIVVVLAITGVVAAALFSRRPRPGEPSEADVTQALRQAREDTAAMPRPAARAQATPAPSPMPAAPPSRAAAADSAAEKSRFVHFVKGFDVSDLGPERRALFLRFANAERCTCGCGYTLAGCRAYDPTCPISEPRVQKLLDSVRAGLYTLPPDAHPRPARGG